MAAQNTFKGANTEFPNLGIHFILSEIIKFRKQLTVRQEFKSQSGWNNALNRYMVTEIEKIGDTLENITYNPDALTQEEIEAQAADTTRSVADDYNEVALTQDNGLMAVGGNRTVPWDVWGTDVDIPQLHPGNCPNDAARSFIAALDNLFVELTRVDSRHQPYSLTKYETVMIRSLLNVLYTLTQRKGGEVNRSDIPTGTLPSDEATTFGGA